MIYIDTSAFLPMFIRESSSERVIAWLESSAERLAISDWTLVEFASATSIKVRSGQTSENLAKKAKAKAEQFARNHCLIVVPGREEFAHATTLAGNAQLRLRAGDALHLAIARRVNAQAMLCLDDDFREGAAAVGLVTVNLQ